MRHPSEWFSTVPNIDDYTARPRRWWHRSFEIEGGPEARVKLSAGDITTDMESDTGQPAGAALTFDVRLWENVGRFDYDNQDRYHDHSITVVIWRWGVYFAWRGGLKR